MFLKLLYNLFTFTIYLYLYKKYISYNVEEVSIIKTVLYLILTFILYISINFKYLFINLILILFSILINTNPKTLDNFIKLDNIKYSKKIKNYICNLNQHIINYSLFYYYDNIFNYIYSKLINFNFHTHNNNELKDNMLNEMKDMIKNINIDIDNLENIKKIDDKDMENEINILLDNNEMNITLNNNNKMIIDIVNLMNKLNSDILYLNKDDKTKEIEEVNKEEIKDDKLEDYLS